MIDITQVFQNVPPPVSADGTAPARRKEFHMRAENDRMAGSVPVWEYRKVETVEDEIAERLSVASGSVAGEGDFRSALAYADRQAAGPPEDFGIGDLIDIVNPLQHIPLVGHVYRAVTGDEIKPAIQVVGGALFGGIGGAASGLANAIAENETGRDIADNVVAMVTEREPKASPPERQIDLALETLEDNPAAVPDLPVTVLGFTDMGGGKRKIYEQIPAADGRTAGSMVRERIMVSSPIPSRQPITQVTLRPMPDEV